MISTSPFMVTVAVTPVAACKACLDGRGCGMGLFSSISKQQADAPVTLQLKVSGADYEPGQRIVLVDEDRSAFNIALWCYGLPLLGLLIGASLGAVLDSRFSVLAASIGLAFGLCLAVFHFRRPAVSECLGQFRIMPCAN